MFLDKIALSPLCPSLLPPPSSALQKTHLNVPHLIVFFGINMVKNWIFMGFWDTGIEWVLSFVFIFIFLNLFISWILSFQREEKILKGNFLG